MCRPVECMVCHKTTWAGCGAHVQQVMSVVPPDKRCECSPEEKAKAGGGGIFDAIKKVLGPR